MNCSEPFGTERVWISVWEAERSGKMSLKGRTTSAGTRPAFAILPMRRTFTIWLLLAVLGLPLSRPVMGSWRCPDGTPCVARSDGSFQCAGGACQMACCEEPSDGCQSLCRHGALPGSVADPDAGAPRQPGIGCTCLFTPTEYVAPTALPPAKDRLVLTDSFAAVLAFDPPLAVELRVVRYVSTSDPSPPSSPGLPPPGSRAPPFV